MTLQKLALAQPKHINRERLTLAYSPSAACCPKAGIQKRIPLVAGLEFDCHAEFILLDGTVSAVEGSLSRSRTSLGPVPPALGPCGDVCWGVVVGLKNVAGVASRWRGL